MNRAFVLKGYSALDRIGDLRLEDIRPCSFFESHEHETVTDQQGTFDQHAIGRKQVEHFILGHRGQFFFQSHGLVEKTACVEEFLHGQSALFMPCGELCVCGTIGFDVPKFIGDALRIEPVLCLLTGGTFGIADKLQHDISPFRYVYRAACSGGCHDDSIFADVWKESARGSVG